MCDDKNTKSKHPQMKKALLTASVASMLDNFNRSNMDILLSFGYEVTLAANFCTEEDNTPQKNIKIFAEEMKAKGVKIKQIDFSRNPKNIREQFRSVKQMKELVAKERFDIIHCHSPIGAAITRIVAGKFRKKHHLKIIYTAHGFHFYKGAPFKNWLIYYPMEYILSRYTDILITLNAEDYRLAKRKFKIKDILYVPGVGIDIEKFGKAVFNMSEKKKELGLGEKDIMLLSVGDLSANKNHEAVILAMGKLNNKSLHYYIAGKGKLENMLKKTAEANGCRSNVHILGYRTDIAELCQVADIFVFPSLREGLPVALMEAMAAGVPCIATKIRGNVDLIESGKNGILTSPDSKDIAKAIVWMCRNAQKRHVMGRRAKRRIQKFSSEKVRMKMEEVYKKCV